MTTDIIKKFEPHYNVALGTYACAGSDSNNSDFNCNVGVGYQALTNLKYGNFNVALGFQSLLSFSGTGDSNNTAVGASSGYTITNGLNNTILGYYAGVGITTGSNNTIIGANIAGLSPTLSDTVITASSSNIRIKFGSTGIPNIPYANIPLSATGRASGDIYKDSNGALYIKS